MTEQGNANVQASTSTKTTIDEPSMFNVYLLNDDYTPMDFVTEILKTIFRKSPKDAEAVMMQIHEEGKGVAGTFTHEIAEQKAIETTAQARSQGHPLNCTVEKA
tara:strand:- start:2337 stop:2648 length:312 start_codon:yes stop_codon:yes gene_type:complete